jgi:protoporphyrinogen oxidase
MKPVVIVGAGLAGLTAATYLRRHGVRVRVFEGGRTATGVAHSARDTDGFADDFGVPFITNRLAAAVGVSTECRAVPRYGETVWLAGRTYSYPFGPGRRPRFLLSAVAAKLGGPFRRPPATAADRYRRAYGRRFADEVAIPLAEARTGAAASELAPAVGESCAPGLARRVVLKTAAALTGRSVAESPHVWRVYPEGGIGAVCERLAEEVSDAIATQTPVEAIHVEEERVAGVRAGGTTIEASAVINTAPVNVLAKLVRGTDRLAYLSRFKYRPVVFVNLRLDGPSGLPDVVTWTPGPETPFFRLSDIGAALPWLVPAGKALVTCDIGCWGGDPIWALPDAELGRLCVAGLERLVPGASRRYLGCRVMRTPVAYPVYRSEYEAERQRFRHDTGVAGLLSVGRTGAFADVSMEDVYWRTRRSVMALLDTMLLPPTLIVPTGRPAPGHRSRSGV